MNFTNKFFTPTKYHSKINYLVQISLVSQTIEKKVETF